MVAPLKGGCATCQGQAQLHTISEVTWQPSVRGSRPLLTAARCGNTLLVTQEICVPNSQQPRWISVTGYSLTALTAFALIASATMKFMHSPQMVQMFTVHFGFPEHLLQSLALLELIVACAYLAPLARTSFVGTIVMTGYLGGAIATHVRVGEPFVPPLLLAIFAWAGLLGRQPCLRRVLAQTSSHRPDRPASRTP